MNSFFQKKLHRRWTWVSPNGRTKNEIDFFITTRKRFVTDVTVLNKFGIGSDHRAVRITVRINARNERQKMIRKKQQIKWETPEDIDAYNTFLTKSLNTNQSLDINILNEEITGTILKAQQKYCKRDGDKEEKISKNTKDLIRQRKLLVEQQKEDTSEIRTLNKTISKEIRKDLRKYNTEKTRQVIEENKSMKVLRRRLADGKKKIVKLKDNNKKETNNRRELVKIVEEFYKELYRSRREELNITENKMKVVNQGSELVPEITIEESKNAPTEMKNKKAAGEDQIVIEAVKVGGEKLLKEIISLFNLCLQKGEIPEKWRNATIILIHKKGDITNFENYRPISLLSHLYKWFTKIVTKRLERKLDFYQSREQAGFRIGYGTNDHLQTIKILIEKSIEYNRPLVMIFVDFRKAFDTVELPAILSALQQCRIYYRYANSLNTFMKTQL
ncbi:uncharacterized protein LOC130443041 [Diorhabda sublineata]|uniref:uncharacterized protein LOC130443041 n=1 Tax=Diorhabda sublineata TaxID=1163346 RepID=UPI0024E194B8|nr:uncharacterized protein LOC130443041 [Diorhabda sublineata]